MGSSVQCGESDSGNLLPNLPSDAAGSEWSAPNRTPVSPSDSRENDAYSHQETDDMQVS